MDPAVEPVADKTTRKKREPEPGFRKALRRVVQICGSLGAVERRSGGRISKVQLQHLLNVTPAMTIRWAIICEQAVYGEVNRVEFYPELFTDNPQGLERIKKMIRSKRAPIRDGELVKRGRQLR